MKNLFIITANGNCVAALTSFVEAVKALPLAPPGATIVTTSLHESAQEYHQYQVEKLMLELPSFQKK